MAVIVLLIIIMYSLCPVFCAWLKSKAQRQESMKQYFLFHFSSVYVHVSYLTIHLNIRDLNKYKVIHV